MEAGVCDRADAGAQEWRGHPSFAYVRENRAAVYAFVSMADKCVSLNRELAPAPSESAYTRGTDSIVNDTGREQFETRPIEYDDALSPTDKRV